MSKQTRFLLWTYIVWGLRVVFSFIPVVNFVFSSDRFMSLIYMGFNEEIGKTGEIFCSIVGKTCIRFWIVILLFSLLSIKIKKLQKVAVMLILIDALLDLIVPLITGIFFDTASFLLYPTILLMILSLKALKKENEE